MATKKLRPRATVRRGTAVLAAVSALAILAGCSATSDSGSSSDSGTPSGTLQVLVSSADASDAAFRAINKSFEAKYPKVKVVFSTISNDKYPAAESSRLTAGNVDVLVAKPVQVPSYAKDSEADDARLAESGSFIDLTKQSFMKNYTPSVLSSIAFKGKQYTIPTGISYETGVYYNKDIFKKYGIDVPTTWSEFEKVADTLKSDGVTPLGIGGKDSWPAGLPMLAAVQGQYPTTADKEGVAKNLWNQKTKLTDAKPQAILDTTEKVFGYAQQNFAGVPYSATPGAFAAGQYAMTPDGTWNYPTIASAVASKFDIGYFPLPTSDTAANNQYLTGKVELRLAAASSTKNKTAALAYLKFFSDPTNYKTFVKLSGFAPAEPNIPSGDFLDSISQYTKKFVPAWDQIWVANTKAGNAALFPFNYVSLTPMGTDSAKAAAQQAQQDWAAAF